VVSEAVIWPEMLEAGVEALTESRIRGLTDLNTCVAVFLAMRAIEQIAVMQDNGSIH
jgi:hypothetical protein